MALPAELREFACQDYVDSQWSKTGYWDEDAQWMLIVPVEEAHVDSTRGMLMIGGPGVDLVRWGYRREHAGVWTYSPIDESFVKAAESVADLVEKWRAGRLTV